jgi:hypothetical protein
VVKTFFTYAFVKGTFAFPNDESTLTPLNLFLNEGRIVINLKELPFGKVIIEKGFDKEVTQMLSDTLVRLCFQKSMDNNYGATGLNLSACMYFAYHGLSGNPYKHVISNGTRDGPCIICLAKKNVTLVDGVKITTSLDGSIDYNPHRKLKQEIGDYNSFINFTMWTPSHEITDFTEVDIKNVRAKYGNVLFFSHPEEHMYYGHKHYHVWSGHFKLSYQGFELNISDMRALDMLRQLSIRIKDSSNVIRVPRVNDVYRCLSVFYCSCTIIGKGALIARFLYYCIGDIPGYLHTYINGSGTISYCISIYNLESNFINLIKENLSKGLTVSSDFYKGESDVKINVESIKGNSFDRSFD